MCAIALLVLLVGVRLNLVSSPAYADGCTRSSLAGNLVSEGSRAKLSLKSYSSRCGPPSAHSSGATPRQYYTYEILCNADNQPRPDTLCSVAPCLQTNQSFALRTIRFPDGRAEPAGWDCLRASQAIVSPGVTLSQVYDAVQKVELPGGTIGVTPKVRGLSNLASFFWLEGASQPPVDLLLSGSVLHAEFRVVEYRWAFGDDQGLVTTGPGSPGLDSEVSTTFRRRGFYRVGVTVAWVAEAWLDGRRVGEVNDLVSRAQTTYPVAELRTVLTG